MRLAIISHTEHYRTETGSIVGWGPTVTEINHLTEVFEEIYHIAMLKDSVAPASALAYTSDAITFVPIPASGGTTFFSKLDSLMKAPKVISIVAEVLKKVDVFQLRAPTGIGVYLIPYITFFVKTPGWYKYAGNWNQPHPPLGYVLQRQFLKWQKRKVTINGFWDDQPEHCLSFENPCLTEVEVKEGIACMAQKSYKSPIHLCFVGRLEAAKGIDLIMDAIAMLPTAIMAKIGVIHIVGDGVLMNSYKQRAASLDIPFIFHGFLSRTEVHAIYKESHALLLPSASEGFPKVIAEAMNYGCVPIVSNVSSIGHYIKDGSNGFLLKTLDAEGLVQCLLQLTKFSEQDYKAMTLNAPDFVKRYTYGYYNQRLLESVL